MWNLPRVIHVKVPPPKHQKPESTKPLKSKSPDPGTYNPNYGLCSERIKVKKIYPSNSKQKFSFDEQVKQSKMRPPVGTYTVTSDSLKRLSATPLSLRILRHWLLLLKWIGLLFCLDRSLPMGFWCVYSFSLCTRRFENGSGMASLHRGRQTLLKERIKGKRKSEILIRKSAQFVSCHFKTKKWLLFAVTLTVHHVSSRFWEDNMAARPTAPTAAVRWLFWWFNPKEISNNKKKIISRPTTWSFQRTGHLWTICLTSRICSNSFYKRLVWHVVRLSTKIASLSVLYSAHCFTWSHPSIWFLKPCSEWWGWLMTLGYLDLHAWLLHRLLWQFSVAEMTLQFVQDEIITEITGVSYPK